jgi:hypothetical protein
MELTPKVGHGVDEFEALKASNFNKKQYITIGCAQETQYQSLTNKQPQ